jgi:hypothetical protein
MEEGEERKNFGLTGQDFWVWGGLEFLPIRNDFFLNLLSAFVVFLLEESHSHVTVPKLFAPICDPGLWIIVDSDAAKQIS